MSAIAGSEFLQAGVLVALVVACALPLSGYLVDVMEGRPLLIRRALGPLERSACRLVSAREDDGMDWRRFLASALAFTAVSFIGLFPADLPRRTALEPRGLSGACARYGLQYDGELCDEHQLAAYRR